MHIYLPVPQDLAHADHELRRPVDQSSIHTRTKDDMLANEELADIFIFVQERPLASIFVLTLATTIPFSVKCEHRDTDFPTSTTALESREA